MVARVEPRTNAEGKVEALRVLSGDVHDIAAAMLDVEANKGPAGRNASAGNIHALGRAGVFGSDGKG